MAVGNLCQGRRITCPWFGNITTILLHLLHMQFVTGTPSGFYKAPKQRLRSRILGKPWARRSMVSASTSRSASPRRWNPQGLRFVRASESWGGIVLLTGILHAGSELNYAGGTRSNYQHIPSRFCLLPAAFPSQDRLRCCVCTIPALEADEYAHAIQEGDPLPVSSGPVLSGLSSAWSPAREVGTQWAQKSWLPARQVRPVPLRTGATCVYAVK